MRFEKYNSRHYPVLAAAAQKLNVDSLLHRDFVDYYYQGQSWSELFMCFNDDDSCAAFLGLDRLRFEHHGQELVIAMATNFYTLNPGTGGFLWLQWMKSCPAGMVFGGSEDSHHILKKQKFTYYSGINVYGLNTRYSAYQGDSAWRAMIKFGMRAIARKRISASETQTFREKSASITIEETSSENARCVEANCFSFRFAPTEDYLRWRYNSTLPFVRYRWFEISAGNRRVGYCILNDAPNQIIVAHSDGTDPETLAYGILKAIFLAASNDQKKRAVLLASSHPVMQTIFQHYGFSLDLADRSMAIGSLRSSVNLPEPKTWLINFGLGDNDLRPSTFHSTA